MGELSRVVGERDSTRVRRAEACRLPVPLTRADLVVGMLTILVHHHHLQPNLIQEYRERCKVWSDSNDVEDRISSNHHLNHLFQFEKNQKNQKKNQHVYYLTNQLHQSPKTISLSLSLASTSSDSQKQRKTRGWEVRVTSKKKKT